MGTPSPRARGHGGCCWDTRERTRVCRCQRNSGHASGVGVQGGVYTAGWVGVGVQGGRVGVQRGVHTAGGACRGLGRSVGVCKWVCTWVCGWAWVCKGRWVCKWVCTQACGWVWVCKGGRGCARGCARGCEGVGTCMWVAVSVQGGVHVGVQGQGEQAGGRAQGCVGVHGGVCRCASRCVGGCTCRCGRARSGMRGGVHKEGGCVHKEGV